VSDPSGPVHAHTVIGIIDTVRLKPGEVKEKEECEGSKEIEEGGGEEVRGEENERE
jgi:hypothetical protein